MTDETKPAETPNNLNVIPADYPEDRAWPPEFGVIAEHYLSSYVAFPADYWHHLRAATYATEAEAELHRAECTSVCGGPFVVVPLLWEARDAGSPSGFGAPPVWRNEQFWEDHKDIHNSHFTRVSTTDPTLLAYYQNNSKAQRGIRTPIKAGRYLAKFFGNVLTPKQIALYAAWQTTGAYPSEYMDAQAYPLAYARTPDDIEDVYTSGPASCMSHSAGDYDSPCHPTRVYGAGDLAIAYLQASEDGSKPIARALVWPEKKVFGRVYPTEHCWVQDGFANTADSVAASDALFARLKSEGFSSYREGNGDGFSGARLLKIDAEHGRVVMPYLDGGGMFSDCGDYLRIDKHGDYDADTTSGTARTDPKEPKFAHYCEQCEEGTDDFNTVFTAYRSGNLRGAQNWCDYCVEQHSYTCEGTDCLVWDGIPRRDVDGVTYCLPYLEDYDHFYLSDYDGEWHDQGVDPSVSLDDGATWTEAEFEDHGFRCLVTGARLPNEALHPDHASIAANADEALLAAYLAAQIALAA